MKPYSASSQVPEFVDWEEVPLGAMIQDEEGDFTVRLPRGGCCIYQSDLGLWNVWEEFFSWDTSPLYISQARIVALEITGKESRSDLQEVIHQFIERTAN